MTKNQIAVLILAMCLVFLANNGDARPTNYCTADEKNNFTNKIDKIDIFLGMFHLFLSLSRELKKE